jgi:hypothetical protein
MYRLAPVFLLLALVGCGGGPVGEPRKAIALNEVPADVMKVARDKLPDVKFDRAWKKHNGEFEISGKNKIGKVREIDLKPDGTVTEIE